jgi:hypothetical protein
MATYVISKVGKISVAGDDGFCFGIHGGVTQSNDPDDFSGFDADDHCSLICDFDEICEKHIGKTATITITITIADE